MAPPGGSELKNLSFAGESSSYWTTTKSPTRRGLPPRAPLPTNSSSSPPKAAGRKVVPPKGKPTLPKLTSPPKAPPRRMATHRKRNGGRGNGQGDGGELQLWNSIQDDLRRFPTLIRRADDTRQKIIAVTADLDHREKVEGIGASVAESDALSALIREEIKINEEILTLGKTGESNTMQSLGLLRAVVKANETAASTETGRRAGSSKAAPSSAMAMDIDTVDSPAPSLADKPSRKDRLGASRGSLPPKDTHAHTPVKQESLEAGNSSGVEVNAKGKITFAMGAEVAFRPKATGAEEPEWIQGVVVKIIGEGKSRRYDVQDPEPDEVTKKPGQIYRTSAASMVTIPPPGLVLADYPAGKHVLARYPDTTTFYRAEVLGMNGRAVTLRFEGEDDASETKEVDRRFVLDHRG